MMILMRKNGFTLTELLVVIGIVAFIAITAFSTIVSSTRAARDQKRYRDLDAMEAALYSFYAQNGHFPRTDGSGSLLWFGKCNGGAGGFQTNDYIPGLSPEFITELPSDPQDCRNNPGNYDGYIYKSNGNDFKIASDWMAEEGTLCDNPGDKYYDPRGTINMAGHEFCSVSTPGGVGW